RRFTPCKTPPRGLRTAPRGRLGHALALFPSRVRNSDDGDILYWARAAGRPGVHAWAAVFGVFVTRGGRAGRRSAGPGRCDGDRVPVVRAPVAPAFLARREQTEACSRSSPGTIVRSCGWSRSCSA